MSLLKLALDTDVLPMNSSGNTVIEPITKRLRR